MPHLVEKEKKLDLSLLYFDFWVNIYMQQQQQQNDGEQFDKIVKHLKIVIQSLSLSLFNLL